MAMMQPPGETEFATKQDVQRVEQDVHLVRQDVHLLRQDVQHVDEKVERLAEQVRGLEKSFHRMDEKLDAVLTVMREHMASKGDVERMARVFAMWLATATLGAVIAILSRS